MSSMTQPIDKTMRRVLFTGFSLGTVRRHDLLNATGLSWGEALAEINRLGLKLPRVDPSLNLSPERQAFEDEVWAEIARRRRAKITGGQ